MQKASEQAAVVATIDPDAYTAAAYTSDWVADGDFHKVMAVLCVGEMQATSTVDLKLQEATDASGTGAQDLSGYAITQLTQAGSDSDKQAIIEIATDALSDGFTHVAAVMTVGTAASDAGVTILGVDGRYGPASDSDLASVAEIVG